MDRLNGMRATFAPQLKQKLAPGTVLAPAAHIQREVEMWWFTESMVVGWLDGWMGQWVIGWEPWVGEWVGGWIVDCGLWMDDYSHPPH